MRTKFPNVLSACLLIIPSSLLSRIFLPNFVAQFKNSISFSSIADLPFKCDFLFCQSSRPVIFGFCFDISFTFTLTTVGAAFLIDSVCIGSSQRLVRFKKEISFNSGVGKGKFSSLKKSSLCSPSSLRKAYSVLTPLSCTRLTYFCFYEL